MSIDLYTGKQLISTLAAESSFELYENIEEEVFKIFLTQLLTILNRSISLNSITEGGKFQTNTASYQESFNIAREATKAVGKREPFYIEYPLMGPSNAFNFYMSLDYSKRNPSDPKIAAGAKNPNSIEGLNPRLYSMYITKDQLQEQTGLLFEVFLLKFLSKLTPDPDLLINNSIKSNRNIFKKAFYMDANWLNNKKGLNSIFYEVNSDPINMFHSLKRAGLPNPLNPYSEAQRSLIEGLVEPIVIDLEIGDTFNNIPINIFIRIFTKAVISFDPDTKALYIKNLVIDQFSSISISSNIWTFSITDGIFNELNNSGITEWSKETFANILKLDN